MSAVRIGSLAMSPAIAGIDAGVVLKVDIACDGFLPSIPILKRILTVPDDIVPVTDVDLGIIA
jgi:hypothetical protein